MTEEKGPYREPDEPKSEPEPKKRWCPSNDQAIVASVVGVFCGIMLLIFIGSALEWFFGNVAVWIYGVALTLALAVVCGWVTWRGRK